MLKLWKPTEVPWQKYQTFSFDFKLWLEGEHGSIHEFSFYHFHSCLDSGWTWEMWHRVACTGTVQSWAKQKPLRIWLETQLGRTQNPTCFCIWTINYFLYRTKGVYRCNWFNFKTKHSVNRNFSDFTHNSDYCSGAWFKFSFFRGLDHSGAETARMLNPVNALNQASGLPVK